jgi:hypothetical protein
VTDARAVAARAAYFRRYYLAHREAILEKKRRGYAEHRAREVGVTEARAVAARAAYFHRYYLAHREAILEKNRRWYEEHRARAAELRRRRPRRPRPPRYCVDCGSPVVASERCKRCYARHRYQTDPAYRARRLASTRRWLTRRRRPPRG